MKIAIGIISYLPNDKWLRQERIKHLRSLVLRCDELFDLPILIVAQNWGGDEVKSKNITLVSFPNALGITKARKELRRRFLKTDNDYLILLDDDCVLLGSKLDALKYINAIKTHANGFATKRKWLLKLTALSRDVIEKCDLPAVTVENNEGYEDLLWLAEIRARLPTREFSFHDGLTDVSNSIEDPLSVWRTDKTNDDLLAKNSDEFLRKLKML